MGRIMGVFMIMLMICESPVRGSGWWRHGRREVKGGGGTDLDSGYGGGVSVGNECPRLGIRSGVIRGLIKI
jgi:hypothetical protein